jgi:hypothetical protein
MGERFRQVRARAFKQQQCRAYELELEAATLFSRTPDVLQQSYCCESKMPVDRLVGEKVMVQPRNTGVAIIHGNVEIGRVSDSDASAVARAISEEPHCPGFAMAVIEDGSSLTSEFDIRLVDHRKEDK